MCNRYNKFDTMYEDKLTSEKETPGYEYISKKETNDKVFYCILTHSFAVIPPLRFLLMQ